MYTSARDRLKVRLSKDPSKGPQYNKTTITSKRENIDAIIDKLDAKITAHVRNPIADILRNIIQISAARIEFNETLHKHFKDMSPEELKREIEEDFLSNQDLDFEREEALEILIRSIQSCVQINAFRNDSGAYKTLIEIIEKYVKAPEKAIEEIHTVLLIKIYEEKFATSLGPPDNKIISTFFQTNSYLELPHLEKMESQLRTLFSPHYIEFIESLIPSITSTSSTTLRTTFRTDNKDKLKKIKDDYKKMRQDLSKRTQELEPHIKQTPHKQDIQSAENRFFHLKKQLNGITLLPDGTFGEKIKKEFLGLCELNDSIKSAYKKCNDLLNDLEQNLKKEPAIALPIESPPPPFIPVPLPEIAPAAAPKAMALPEPAPAPLRPSEEEDEKGGKELIFSQAERFSSLFSRRPSLLGSKHQRVIEAIFSPKTENYSLDFAEVINLLKALGGEKVEQEGSRFRFKLKNRLGDVPITTPALHAPHGGDKRNGKISRSTIDFFKSLFERAGFTPATTAALMPEAAKAANRP